MTTNIEILNELVRVGEGLNLEEAISEADILAYFEVVLDAFEIHLDRERIRRGLWKDYPAADQLRNIRTKADRIFRSLEGLPHLPVGSLNTNERELRDSILEELHDIINYAIFTARKLRGE